MPRNTQEEKSGGFNWGKWKWLIIGIGVVILIVILFMVFGPSSSSAATPVSNSPPRSFPSLSPIAPILGPIAALPLPSPSSILPAPPIPLPGLSSGGGFNPISLLNPLPALGGLFGGGGIRF